MNNSIYDNWREYDMDNQLNTTICFICKDDMSSMRSYQKWHNKTQQAVYVCSICFLEINKDLETYPVKGLHFGDNS